MEPVAKRPFEGRVAVITGGTRGIGRAIVSRLARDGAHCVITYRRSEALAGEVVDAVEREGVKGLALALDLIEPSQVSAVIEEVGETFGRLDILVANAAATAFRSLLQQKEHNVRRTLAISVDSFIALVQAAVPLMRGRSGRIVAVSGIDSFQAMGGHGVLGCAKAALESLVRAFAYELGRDGITVNGVNPGFIGTDSSRAYVERGLGCQYEAAIIKLAAATPVRRIGTVDDVADCVAWIVSGGAGFLTGQTIVLDGGLTIVSPLTRLEETADVMKGSQRTTPPPDGR
jgi:enoyl-[acyl-carrier protein] reductase III